MGQLSGDDSFDLGDLQQHDDLSFTPGYAARMLTIDPHPLLDLHALVAAWPETLDAVDASPLDAVCGESGAHPFEAPDDAHKQAVRDLLRHGGFKPAGRSKPCWEYLVGVAAKGAFPRINAAVDATNAAALHGALPVSTVDLDRLTTPLRVGIAPGGSRYVFNASGQELDLSGLLCLFDAEGPCANAVKDAQRAKTTGETRQTLTLIWGTAALPGRGPALARWQAELFERCGAVVHTVTG